MAEDDKKAANFPLDETKEEQTRQTPKAGPEAGRSEKDRTSELPADEEVDELQKRRDAANSTANQTIDEGNENEVEGKLATPTVKVMKRGQTLWTDEDGNRHKELNAEEPNARLEDEATPDYLKLHQEVLDGRDPLEATLDYQGREEEQVREGDLKNAELHPRTRGLGMAEEK